MMDVNNNIENSEANRVGEFSYKPITFSNVDETEKVVSDENTHVVCVLDVRKK